jgi:hypothetical protein
VSEQPPSEQPPGTPERDPPAGLAPDAAPTVAAAAGNAPPVSPPQAAHDPVAGGISASDFHPAGSGSPFPADRPEVAVGAAFAGGLVLALILKRLAR